MTEDEFREKMHQNGWDDKEVDRILKLQHEDEKKGIALPLESWPITPKPSIFHARQETKDE